MRGGSFLEKYLSNKQMPWKRRRRLGIVIAGVTPAGSWLNKIGKLPTAGCRLCKRAREARGQSTQELPNETHGHINSAGCERMAEAVTAAHHSIWRHLLDSIHAAKKEESTLEFVTLDTESNMRTWWKREEFANLCSEQQVSEKAQKFEEKLPVLKHQQARWAINPESFFVNRFWGKRSDGNRYKENNIVCLGIQAVNRQGGGVFRDERNSGK